MKRISKLSMTGIWIILIYILFRLNLLTGNTDNLQQFFNSCGGYKALIFIALSSLRIAVLIPSAAFMLLGGMIFNPFEGIVLTLISVILSETIVYITSKILISSNIQNYLVKKYPRLNEMLLRNKTKLLAMGILCPMAPSDIICFLASSTGMSYRKFILTVIVSNMPMIILYGFLGDSFASSAASTVIIVSVIAAISIYSIYLWNREQKAHLMNIS